MNIQEITTYRIDGKTFASLKEAKTYLENEIGAILDRTPLRMEPKQALAVFQAVVENKQRLCGLLSVIVDRSKDDCADINLLDFDL